MPIYEYRCNNCNKKFEFFHKSINNEEKVICPDCSSSEIKKVFSKFSASVGESSSFKSYQPSSNCSTGGCASGLCNLN